MFWILGWIKGFERKKKKLLLRKKGGLITRLNGMYKAFSENTILNTDTQ